MESTKNTAQIGLVAKILKEPSLIMSEPVKFCSAKEPKIIPMMTPGTPTLVLAMKKPIIPAANMM